MPACPSCGQENPAIARHCLACGARLLETPLRTGEERKVVTVLFCDLVGFTMRSDRSDPEDVRATLSSYFTRLRRAIERFGGTAEKFIGDAVVAVFGAPTAHEDDPERAVRCAFAMLRAIDDLNAASPELDLAVRIGIDTGVTLVALGSEVAGEGIVTGDVVNTAARLQEVAPIGGIVLTEATYRATKNIVDYEQLAPVSVKGKGEPLRIWRPLAIRSRYGADVDRPAGTPFVGREDELELLKRTFSRALREPSVQLVTIMGEPGVGKSRLVREFFAHIDALPQLIYWRQGRCLPYGEGITYWALSQIVKAQAGILESDQPETSADKLDSMLGVVLGSSGEHDWIRGKLGPLVGVAQPEPATADRSEIHAAWREFFEAMSSDRPMVLVFEDLHWADPPMLEFIEHLVGWSSQVPMLVLCTARPELFERSPGWAGGQRNATTISLAPLSWDETAGLISTLMFDAILPMDSQTSLLERAGGNPLYAEEFAQMVRDRDLPMEFAFPESVHALIASRLDALPPALKGLLQDASVIGKVFWSGALSALSDLDDHAVSEGLHELARRELVRPVRLSSVKDEAEFGFWHVLIRDVAHEGIPRAARARKHLAVAEWIERLTGGRSTERAELLAYHYGQALELAEAAGTSDELPQMRERLLRSLLLAGEAAMSLDIGRATEHYARALDLVPPGHPERGGILAKTGTAAHRYGRFEEAERAYEEAIAIATAAGATREAGDAMVGLASVLWHRGETARSRHILDDGIRLLEAGGPSQELGRAYTEQAITCATSGLLDDAVTWSNKSLEMAEGLGLPAQRAQSLAFRGGARCELGDLGGLDDLHEALAVTRELGLARETAQAQVILAGVLWATEGPRASLESFRAGIEAAEHRGITDMAMAIRSQLLGSLFDLGEWDRLLEEADRVTRWFQSQGGGYFEVVAWIWRARVELCRRSTSSAFADLVPAARAIGDVQVLIPGLAVAALGAWAEGDAEAAVGLVEELQGLTGDRSDWYLVAFAPDLVRVCISAGRVELARRLMGIVRETAERNLLCLASARALVEEAEGRHEDAARHFAVAASSWKEYGSVLEHAHALLGEGRCLVRLGREEASDPLREAGSIFESLGAGPPLVEMEPWAARARLAGSTTKT